MHENGVIVVFVEVKNEVDDDVEVDDYNAIIHDGMSENDEYLALDDNNDESSENDFNCDDVDDDRDNENLIAMMLQRVVLLTRHE